MRPVALHLLQAIWPVPRQGPHPTMPLPAHRLQTTSPEPPQLVHVPPWPVPPQLPHVTVLGTSSVRVRVS
jgi:hypothetical protein